MQQLSSGQSLTPATWRKVELLALAAAGWSESERDDADPPLGDPEDPAITIDDLAGPGPA